MLYSIVGLLVIILDQAVKYWVQNTLFGTDIVKFIPGVISLVNVHNDGAAFSFLSGSGALFHHCHRRVHRARHHCAGNELHLR